MHPLAGDLSPLKDSEIETKISQLTSRYFATSNLEVKSQIAMLLETYKNEIGERRTREWEKITESRDKSLDKLINIS